MKNLLTSLFTVLIVFLLNPLWAETDAELIKIAGKVASGTATPQEQAIAFKYNKEINNLAMEGKINNEIYQKNQKSFDKVNSELANKAAAKNGLDTSGKSKDSYKAGTDSDIQLSSKDKKLTADNVKNARNDYNAEVDNYLKKNGVETKGNENWAKKNETDIMPSPDQMTPSEFKKSAEHINNDGGNMYKNKGAADTQLKIDSGKGGVTIDEGPAYTKELQEKVKYMKDEKAQLQNELKNTTDPERRAHLDTEIKKCESHEAKYIDRINQLDTATKEQYGIKTPEKTGEDMTLKNAKDRNFTKGPDGKISTSEKAAHVTDAISTHKTNQALEKYNNTIAEIGKNPQHTKQSQSIIAENIKNLPPAQQGEAISNLENKFGKEFAKGVAENVRVSRNVPSKPPVSVETGTAGGEPHAKTTTPEHSGTGTKEPTLKKGEKVSLGIAAALGIFTAGLNSYNEEIEAAKRENRKPDYGKMLGKTVYDATVGGYVSAAGNAFKAVTTDTLEYRKQLENEYKKSGADMDSFATQLKIWTQSTVYGTGLGIWHGVHVVPIIGDVLGAGETVIAVTGESLATMDDLNAQSANIQNQEMSQRLTAAQSVQKAEKLLNSMETMGEQVKMLKAELDKNCQWVQNTSGKYIEWKADVENKIRELQKLLDSAAEMKAKNQKSGFFGQDYAAGMIKDFESIKIQAVYHAKRADELMKQYEGLSVKPEERKPIEDIIRDYKENNERFESKISELKYLSEISQTGDMTKYVQALRDNIKGEIKSAQALSDNSVTASKNIDSLVRQITDAAKNLSQVKASIKKAETYFSKKDEKTKAAWEKITARLALIKDIEFNPDEYKRDQEFIRNFPASITNYIKAAKIPDSGDLSWMNADIKNSEKILASLRKPAEETAVELDKASGKIMFLAGLLDLKSCVVNIAVQDSAANSPVLAAKVTLTGAEVNLSEMTGAKGVAFRDVPAGKFLIEVTADGYGTASVKIDVNPALNLEYSEVLKITRQNISSELPSAEAASEIEKIAKEDAKKYASVSDADMKKAENFISYIGSCLERGSLINRTSIMTRDADISQNINNYVGLKYKQDIVRVFLLDKNNIRNAELFKKFSRVAAAKAIEYACYEYSPYFDRIVLAKDAFESAKTANEPLDPLVESAKAFLDFRLKFMFADTVNLSNYKYWDKYCAYYGLKEKKDSKGNKIPLTPEDGEKWAVLIVKGGYDAVAKELDKFWKDKAEAKEKDKFLKENPLAAEDYRNGFISNKIIPALSVWAKKMKEIKDKEFASTLQQAVSSFSQISVSITGRVKCFPEPAPYKVSLAEDSGMRKVIQTKDLSGNAEYSFNLKIEDLKDTSMLCVSIVPVKENIQELDRSGGESFSISLGSSIAPGVKMSFEGNNLKFVIPEALITSRMRPKNIRYDAPEVTVPSMPANNILSYKEPLSLPLRLYKSGEISLEDAYRKNTRIRSEFQTACADFEDKYSAVQSAITHNKNVKRNALVKQGKTAEADALQAEINRTNEEMYKQRDKIKEPWQGMREATHEALYKEDKELSKQRTSLQERCRKRDELQSIIRKEYDEALREYQNILEKWNSLLRNIAYNRESRSQQRADSNDSVLYEGNDKELQKASDDLKNKLKGVAEKLTAVSAKASSWMDSYRQLNVELNSLGRAKSGLTKGVDYDDNLFSDYSTGFSGMRGGYWYQDIKKCIVIADAVAKADMSNFIDKNTMRAEAYLKKKGAYSQDLDALISEAKKLADQISPERVKEADAEFEPIRNDAWAYAYFFQNAVLMGDPSSFKAQSAFLDASGNDTDFVVSIKKKLDAIASKYKDLLSDRLVPPERAPSTLGRLSELDSLLLGRTGDFTSEQSKKFQEMQAKYVKLSYSLVPYNFGELKLVFDEAVRVGGSSPEERIKKVIKLNSDTVKYMKGVSIPSSPETLEKFLSDADRWFGKMRGIPTLDALKTRGEIYSKLYKSGLPEAYRKAHNIPPAPESFLLNGKTCLYNGATIVFRHSQLPSVSQKTAEAYVKSGIKNVTHSLFIGFKKNPDYRMETAAYGSNFYDAGDGSYIREEAMTSDWLPRVLTIYYRQSDKNGNSMIPNEPPVTIIVLP